MTVADGGKKTPTFPYSEDSIFQCFQRQPASWSVTLLALGTSQIFSQDTSAHLCVTSEPALPGEPLVAPAEPNSVHSGRQAAGSRQSSAWLRAALPCRPGQLPARCHQVALHPVVDAGVQTGFGS